MKESAGRIAGNGGVYEAASAVPPRVVDENGAVTKADGPVGFSAAVVPYLHALSMKAEEKVQIDRVAAMKDPVQRSVWTECVVL